MNILNGVPEGKQTPEQELAACALGDKEALILANLREAYYYSMGTYQSRGLSDGEVLSACYSGLASAAKTFRPGSLRFFSFAKAHVRGLLSRTVRSNDVVHKVRDVEPLDEIEHEEDEDPDSTYRKAVSSPDGTAPDFGGIHMREQWKMIEPLMREVLNDKERMVLELHFQGGLNCQEIAALMDYSRSYVHLQKQVALKKIRHCLMERHRYPVQEGA